MDASSTSPGRKRRPKGQSRSRRGSSGGVRPVSLARRVLVISAASAVFIGAFIVDTSAVGRLFWTCLAGHAGWPAQAAAFAVLMAAVFVVGVAFRRPGRPLPTKARKRAGRRPTGHNDQGEKTETGPGDGASTGKSGRKRQSTAASVRPRIAPADRP
jgi:hypothetical protein